MLNQQQEIFFRKSEEDAQLEKIQAGFANVEHEWLKLHYITSVGLMLLACIVEMVMGIMLIHSDMLSTTVSIFVYKFMIFPMGLNLLLIIVDTVVILTKRLSYHQKMYFVSLIFTAICLVLFAVHGTFPAMFYLFAIAIMLTTIYASYRLTLTVSAVSLVSITFSEIFVVWDLDKPSIFSSTARMSDFAISVLILIGFSIACMAAIRYQQRRNAQSIQMEMERQYLKQSLKVDEMTGIYNRNALHAAMKDVEVFNPEDKYILAIADIDHFKQVNDHYGHHAGDRCIEAFAEILKDCGSNAVPYRYGGDEFCLIFRGVDMDKAVETCNQVRIRLGQKYLEDCPGLQLTASFGLAMYEQGMDEARFFIYADIALYKAKEVRNAVHVFLREEFY